MKHFLKIKANYFLGDMKAEVTHDRQESLQQRERTPPANWADAKEGKQWKGEPADKGKDGTDC